MTEEEYENILKRQSSLEEKIEQMEEQFKFVEGMFEKIIEQVQDLNKNFIKLSESCHTVPVDGFSRGKV